MERNDLRKSKTKDKGIKSKGEENEDEPRKSSGLVRTKPCREIYRPPKTCILPAAGVRKEGKQFSGESTGKFHAMNQNSQQQQIHPLSARQQANARQLNVHAKEFTFPAPVMSPPTHQNYFGGMTPGYYGGDGGNSPMYNPRCFPLQQSKSSGSVQNYFHLWNQHQQQQAQAQAQRQMYNQQSEANYYALQQSKSSGNIIGNGNHVPSSGGKNGKNVRFDFSSTSNPSEELRESVKASMADNRMAKLQRDLEMTKESFATLNIDGSGVEEDCRHLDSDYGSSVYSSPKPGRKFSHSKNQLQKSISTFYVPNSSSENIEEEVNNKFTHMIKRSNSFIPKSSIRNGIGTGPGAQLPNYLITNIDLDIKKWPKDIQDSVTTSVISGEKIPARHRISMVAKILDILLLASEEGKHNGEKETEKLNINRANLLEMLPSAVNIFLYFIQREKDRTVMETVLNSCFATYQRLQKLSSEKLRIDEEDESGESGESPSSPCWNEDKLASTLIPRQWSMLLNIVSSIYTKVKTMRIQNQQHPGYKGLDELKTSMMSLLCDSCIVTLRTAPLQSSEIMDLLFTIMTSIGRDMETCHPTKMKQILAAVRDVLLGIKPYGGSVEAASPGVQKTLMQLIELHAANWHLPASAVRYYYYQPI